MNFALANSWLEFRDIERTLYSKSMSAIGVYLSRVSTGPIGMSLTRTAWIKLNRLRTGVSVCPCTNGISLL